MATLCGKQGRPPIGLGGAGKGELALGDDTAAWEAVQPCQPFNSLFINQRSPELGPVPRGCPSFCGEWPSGSFAALLARRPFFLAESAPSSGRGAPRAMRAGSGEAVSPLSVGLAIGDEGRRRGRIAWLAKPYAECAYNPRQISIGRPDAVPLFFRYVNGELRESVTAVTAVGDGVVLYCWSNDEHPDVRQFLQRTSDRRSQRATASGRSCRDCRRVVDRLFARALNSEPSALMSAR